MPEGLSGVFGTRVDSIFHLRRDLPSSATFCTCAPVADVTYTLPPSGAATMNSGET